jgi:alkylation response protein AidB-like acyl-CoA dehydrogenase
LRRYQAHLQLVLVENGRPSNLLAECWIRLEAATRAVMTFGGMGYATESQVERLFRESILLRIAPVTEEHILSFIAEKVLDLPKSY